MGTKRKAKTFSSEDEERLLAISAETVRALSRDDKRDLCKLREITAGKTDDATVVKLFAKFEEYAAKEQASRAMSARVGEVRAWASPHLKDHLGNLLVDGIPTSAPPTVSPPIKDEAFEDNEVNENTVGGGKNEVISDITDVEVQIFNRAPGLEDRVQLNATVTVKAAQGLVNLSDALGKIVPGKTFDATLMVAHKINGNDTDVRCKDGAIWLHLCFFKALGVEIAITQMEEEATVVEDKDLVMTPKEYRATSLQYKATIAGCFKKWTDLQIVIATEKNAGRTQREALEAAGVAHNTYSPWDQVFPRMEEFKAEHPRIKELWDKRAGTKFSKLQNALKALGVVLNRRALKKLLRSAPLIHRT
ncbi:hypothetical protein HKX48_005509 [Thoreauomyces humboldtii]|nr:hypothetical protein HKX48_005509 [Thoreauomyces humboldtii]